MADGISGSSSDDEQLRQQQAAAAAKEATAVKVEADAKAKAATTANPLLAPGVTLTQPVPGTNVLQTPYGTVTGTVPVQTVQTPYGLAAPVPNPFTKPPGPLDANLATQQGQAAEAYRNLPDNTTPEQRASAMEAYRGALGTPAERDYTRVMEGREGNLANELTARGLAPDKQQEVLEKYRTLTPEQQKAEYYNWRSGIEKPGMIGNARMLAVPGGLPGSGGLSVPRLGEVTAARAVASEAAKEVANLQAKEQSLLYPEDEKGRRREQTQAEKKGAAEARVQWQELAGRSGLINPENPKPGLDIERGTRFALDRPRDTLTEVAKGRTTEKKTEQKAQPERTPQEEQTVREAEQRRVEHEAWLEDLRRRAAAYYSHQLPGRV